MRYSLATFMAALALATVTAAEEAAAPALADAAPALTDAAVEEAAFEPNTIVQKHIGGDLLTLSVL